MKSQPSSNGKSIFLSMFIISSFKGRIRWSACDTYMIPLVIVRDRQQLNFCFTSATRAGSLCGQLVFARLVQLSFLSAEDCFAPRTSSFRQNTTSARHRSDWGQPRAGSLVTRWLSREMGAEIVWALDILQG